MILKFKYLLYVFVFWGIFLLLPKQSFATPTLSIANGMDASGVLGQYVDENANPLVPTYTTDDNYGATDHSFNGIEAKDGEEGLDLALKEHPDLILLDLLMPKMDGMTMLKELRKDEWGKNVPVVILTNISSADDKINKDITALEPTYYFVKSEKTLEEIVDKVKERLGLV